MNDGILYALAAALIALWWLLPEDPDLPDDSDQPA